MSTLEKQVAEEQADHVERRRQMTEEPDAVVDAEQQPTQDEVAGDGKKETDAKGDEPKAEEGALFDRSQYETEELALAKVDGQGVDKIAVAFNGRILLDRSDARDVALFRSLKLGKDVELRVAGEVTKTSTGWTTNRDGDLDAIVGERTIKVGTVYVLNPDEL